MGLSIRFSNLQSSLLNMTEIHIQSTSNLNWKKNKKNKKAIQGIVHIVYRNNCPERDWEQNTVNLIFKCKITIANVKRNQNGQNVTCR